MMQILVKGGGVRSGRKAKSHHGRFCWHRSQFVEKAFRNEEELEFNS